MRKPTMSANLAMFTEYDPKNWFWKVGGDETKVFSSSAGDYVGLTDANYLAWTALGNTARAIGTEAELGEVLAQHRVRPTNAGVLDGFKESHAQGLVVEVPAKLLLWIVNEIRVLKGQQPASAAQFKAFVKDQM